MALLAATRRAASTLAAALLASSPFDLSLHPAGAAPTYRAVAVVAGGFLIPETQYGSYAAALEAVGCCSTVCADPSTLSQPCPPEDAARLALDAAEARASALGVPSAAPLFLLGHSRGAKTCVAAAGLSRRRVGGMVLLDPVDATSKDPSSVLPALAFLRVPTAILGTRLGAIDGCAPSGANFDAFAGALDARAPRLVGTLQRGGHTQFVDRRRDLLVDVCSPGKDTDAQVRELALATSAAWVAACVGQTSGSAVDADAVRALLEAQPTAAVTWRG